MNTTSNGEKKVNGACHSDSTTENGKENGASGQQLCGAHHPDGLKVLACPPGEGYYCMTACRGGPGQGKKFVSWTEIVGGIITIADSL